MSSLCFSTSRTMNEWTVKRVSSKEEAEIKKSIWELDNFFQGVVSPSAALIVNCCLHMLPGLAIRRRINQAYVVFIGLGSNRAEIPSIPCVAHQTFDWYRLCSYRNLVQWLSEYIKMMILIIGCFSAVMKFCISGGYVLFASSLLLLISHCWHETCHAWLLVFCCPKFELPSAHPKVMALQVRILCYLKHQFLQSSMLKLFLLEPLPEPWMVFVFGIAFRIFWDPSGPNVYWDRDHDVLNSDFQPHFTISWPYSIDNFFIQTHRTAPWTNLSLWFWAHLATSSWNFFTQNYRSKAAFEWSVGIMKSSDWKGQKDTTVGACNRKTVSLNFESRSL